MCDFLVAIDAGRLLRAAPLGTFTERTGDLAVEVEEGASALAAALTAARPARGRRRPDGRSSPIDDERPYDLVRDAVAELGLPLVRLEQRRQRPRGPVQRRAGCGRGERPRRPEAAMTARSRPAGSQTPATGPGGSIYDLGYQGYHGPRLGRARVDRGAVPEHAPGGLRHRPRRPGEDRAVRARRPGAPAGRRRGRDRGARRPRPAPARARSRAPRRSATTPITA